MRALQRLELALVFAIAFSGLAHSQQTKYPTKPVRLVTVGPGSQNDILARLDAMGFLAVPSTPEAFDKIVRADIQTFRTVGKAAGLIAR